MERLQSEIPSPSTYPSSGDSDQQREDMLRDLHFRLADYTPQELLDLLARDTALEAELRDAKRVTEADNMAVRIRNVEERLDNTHDIFKEDGQYKLKTFH